MKKTIMPLLVCAALLCGCGGGEKTLAVQEQYRTVRTADMEAEVVSHTATDDRRFVLTCQYDTEGQSITTVKEPQELKGLTAVLVARPRISARPTACPICWARWRRGI